MIISHKNRFVFVHCRKVAGSSIKVALSPFLGDSDLQIGGWVDCFDHGIKPNRRAKLDICRPAPFANYLARLSSKPGKILNDRHISWALNGAMKVKYRKLLGPYPDHPHAKDIKLFDEDSWRDYYKFCFVRNPYDKAVSEYKWVTRTRGIKNLTFHDYLIALSEPLKNKKILNIRFDNWPMYTIDDNIVVDRVGRFENLYQDLKDIFGEIGVPFDKESFPKAKLSKDRKSYRSWYSDRERELVAQLFKKEIETFGYDY